MTENGAPPTNGRPDPSFLTTERILREVEVSREIIEARLDGMDKAIALTEKYPTVIDEAVEHLKALHQEKFDSIKTQFEGREEAVAKSEAAVNKLLDQLQLLLDTKTNGIMTQLNDVKNRQTLIEGRSSGAGALWGYIIGGVGLAATILTIVFMMVRPGAM